MPKAGLLAFMAGTVLFSSPAAALTRIGSSAYGVSVNLSVLNAVKASVLSGEGVGDTTAPSYALSDQVAGVSVNALLGSNLLGAARQTVKTGVITSSASSPYEGLGTATATGTATAIVNNLAVGLSTTGALGAINLLTLKVPTLSSTASVSGVNGLSRSGSANLTGLTISGVGIVNINTSLFLNPAANTVLLDLLGIKIVLNEQKSSTVDGKLMTSTNAMHILYDGLLAVNGGFLKGEIIIGHAEAFIRENSASATPEPGTWVQMIFGFGLIGVVARRRTRRTVAA